MKKIAVLISIISILQINLNPVYANPKGVLKKTGGVFSGIIISPMVGGFRGCCKGAKLGTNYVADIVGGSTSSFARGLGFLTGGLVNGALGAIAGGIKCGYEGVKYGLEKPFTKENYCLTGNGITDFIILE